MGERGRLRRLLHDLTGRGDARLIGLVSEQLAATTNGAELVRDVINGRVQPGEARCLIKPIEHAGDEYRARLIREMSRSLTTPIDREDLFRLSRSVDDILDNLRDFVLEADLFGIEDARLLDAVIDAVLGAITELAVAVASVVRDPASVSDGALRAKKKSSRVRRQYQVAVARVLDGVVDAATLKRRELLRRLDVVGLRLGEAADALADGSIKRSH